MEYQLSLFLATLHGKVSESVLPRTRQMCGRILQTVPGETPEPQASISEDGGIELCWHLGHYSFEIEVLEESVAFFFRNQANRRYFWAITDNPEDEIPGRFRDKFIERVWMNK